MRTEENNYLADLGMEARPDDEAIRISEKEADLLIEAAQSGEYKFPLELIKNDGWKRKFGPGHVVLQGVEEVNGEYYKKQIDLLGPGFIGRALNRGKSVKLISQKTRTYPGKQIIAG